MDGKSIIDDLAEALIKNNEYKVLLEECLQVLNEMPYQLVNFASKTTCELANKITKILK